MKWFVCALLLFNLGLWFYTDYKAARSGTEAVSEGRLPRVAELELLPAGQRLVNSVENVEKAKVDQGSVTAPLDADQDKAKKRAGEIVDGESPAPQEQTICVEIGWFDAETAARSAAQSIQAIPDDAKTFQIDRPLTAYHWVILPPFPSRNAAEERFQELQREGVDSYLVIQGPQRNAISLGLFRSRDAAQQVLSQRQARGLNATLASFPRNQIRYGLVFEVGQEPGERLVQAPLDSFDNRFESVSMSDCEGVATTQETP